MRAHVLNAVYGAVDYAAYPVGMLVLAPVVIHRLGAGAYGVWVVAMAIVNTGAVIASGFGDANLQRLAALRGAGNHDALLRTVRSTFGIHLLLGAVLAGVAWLLSGYEASHLAAADPRLLPSTSVALRLASPLVLLRAVESVCVSTQRGFERYGAALATSLAGRLATLVAAAALALNHRSIAAVMAAAVLLTSVTVLWQLMQLQALLRGASRVGTSLMPRFEAETTQALLRYGIFAWLISICGLLFTQADRLILGLSAGAAGVAAYALCAQMAQPIYGLSAAGLHFLFPHLAKRSGETRDTLRQTIERALAVNVAFVLAGTGLLVLLGNSILGRLANAAVAQEGSALLPVVAAGACLMGLTVTGTYSLMALGRVRTVLLCNVAGSVLTLLLMVGLRHRYGTFGVASARLCLGAVTLLLYLPLFRILSNSAASVPAPTHVAFEGEP